MSAPSVTRAGQAAAERLMVDTCTVTRVTAGGAFNETTGQYAADTTSTVYSGKCRVQMRDGLARDITAGERAQMVGRFVVNLPITATGIQVDDTVTITATGTDSDADLTSRTFRVAGLFHKTYATARRLVVEEAQS
jgi:hypothetical protein